MSKASAANSVLVLSNTICTRLFLTIRALAVSIPLMPSIKISIKTKEYSDVSEALHYLVKPVKKEKLFGILDRFFDSVYSLRSVNVKVGRLEESIYLSDILYVEADGKRAKVHTKKGVMEVSMSVAELERVLPEKEFCRPIRWALVSMREIAAMPTDVLKLSDQTEIPISRLKRREIQETFADYSWRSTRRRMRGKTG